MGWWSHCWMRMGSGNGQALGCCSGKRGRAGYPGLHGSWQKLSTKIELISFGSIFPVLSPSLMAHVGSGIPFCLLHTYHRNPGILSHLLLFLCPNTNQGALRCSQPLQIQDRLLHFGNWTRRKGLEVEPQA